MAGKKSTEVTVSINPITRKKIGEFPVHTRTDFLEMLAKARKAQTQWAELTVKERSKHIRKIRNYIVKNCDHLAEIIARETGKVRIDALAAELLPAAIATHYNCKHAARFLAAKKARNSSWFLFYKRNQVVRVPWGVIGIISPWNYPFSIPFFQIIQALLAGNAVILKTASNTQSVARALKEVISAAELPDGLFSCINIPGSKAGSVFLEGGINKLCFIGSAENGKWLMAKAAETLTPINLELGGNDAMLVCEDADIHRAASGAVWAGLSNAGQSCGGVERIYVQEGIYQAFLDVLKVKVEHLRVGYDSDSEYNIDIGGITTEKQFKTVSKQIQDALAKGARIWAQSNVAEDPNWHNLMPATVLINVNHEMDVMRCETFGPILAVMKVKNMDEAIRLANDSNFGLTASVWSKNHRKAIALARQIKAGVLTINDHLMSHGLPETSWGGFKHSGMGRSHGQLGMEEMTQSQTIVNDIMPFVRKDLWWPPYGGTTYKGIRAIPDLLYGERLFGRLRSLFRVLRIFPRVFQSK